MVQFRRSTKVGPFRFTFGKRGVSMSGGVPGARVSVNSRGEVRRTLRLPGTGVYDTQKIADLDGSGSAPRSAAGPAQASIEYEQAASAVANGQIVDDSELAALLRTRNRQRAWLVALAVTGALLLVVLVAR